jgi:hypothetical protein
MKRHHVLILVLAAAFGVSAAMAWRAWEQLSHASAVSRVDAVARDFITSLESGEIDNAAKAVTDGEGDVRPTLTLVSALLRVDLAMRTAFEEGLADRPLPRVVPASEAGITIEDDVAFYGGPPRLVLVHGPDGRFAVDRRPFSEADFSLESARAMADELHRLVERIESGEIEDHEEAAGALQAATLLGALRSIGPD